MGGRRRREREKDSVCVCATERKRVCVYGCVCARDTQRKWREYKEKIKLTMR